MPSPVRVLIVDDSQLACELLSEGLGRDPEIQVVGTAGDPYEARDKIVQLKPDVMTLDIEMPRMNGIEFLRKLMPQFPIPVVMFSALTDSGKQFALDALSLGAVDIVHKPQAVGGETLETVLDELRAKIKIAATVDVSRWKQSVPRATVKLGGTMVVPPQRQVPKLAKKVVAIGASTGGTEAVRQLLVAFPACMPCVLIVQHMPPGFTNLFATRLNGLSQMEVKEADDGDLILPGRALVAPGAKQMRVVESRGMYKVQIQDGPPVNGHCPSVDVMMNSVAALLGPQSIGILLTGMGRDGAAGLKAMRDAGARTISQDKETCVVYGMPREAYVIGAVEKQLPLPEIPNAVYEILFGKRNGKDQ